MAKTPAKKKPVKVRQDFAQNAFRVVQEATGQAERTPEPDAGKDPKAIARGRKGGLIGGPARKAKLSRAKRKAIATKAANARWNG